MNHLRVVPIELLERGSLGENFYLDTLAITTAKAGPTSMVAAHTTLLRPLE